MLNFGLASFRKAIYRFVPIRQRASFLLGWTSVSFLVFLLWMCYSVRVFISSKLYCYLSCLSALWML